MARSVGVPDDTGTGRKISAYYQLRGTPGSAAWIETIIQTILQWGPVTVSGPWPNNWWSCGPTGILPYPQGLAGGHQWVRKGYTLVGPKGSLALGMSPSGRYWRERQSWGEAAYRRRDRFGRAGEFLIPFEADANYPNWAIGEVWKTVDVDEYPTPGGAVKITDSTPKLVTLPEGRQLYQVDGVTPLVKMSSTVTGVYSPAGGPTATQRYVVVTTGGVRQQVVVAAAGLTWAPYLSDVQHTVRLFVDGVSQWEGKV
jgi:hypothetical protein